MNDVYDCPPPTGPLLCLLTEHSLYGDTVLLLFLLSFKPTLTLSLSLLSLSFKRELQNTDSQ